MLKSIATTSLQFLLSAMLFAILSTDGYSQNEPKLSPAAMAQDYRIFEESLKEFHPGLYWYKSQAEMQVIFEETGKTLNQPHTEKEFVGKLAAIISKIGCGHTDVSLSEETEKSKLLKFLPLKLKFSDGKAFFIKSYQEKALPIKPGNEVLAINDIPMDSLINLCLEILVSDGFSNSGKYHSLDSYFWYIYGYYFKMPDLHTIEFKDENQSRQQFEITGMDKDAISKAYNDYKNAEKDNITFRYMEDNQTAVLKIKAFFNWENNGRKYNFSKQLKQVFEKIDSSQTKNLILDLRDNGGGRAPLGLFSFLYDSSFTFFKQMEFTVQKQSEYAQYCDPKLSKLWISGMSKKSKKLNDSTFLLKNEPMLKPYKFANPQFRGRLFVLINGGTFSAASDVAAMIKSHELATFVGVETEGGYYGNTSMETATVKLPNTKVRVSIPLVRHTLTVKNEVAHGRGVIPDFIVEQSVEDILNSVDTQMEYVLSLIK
ncbi:MAG: S41 family peptidase [Bacteroidota bacterium]